MVITAKKSSRRADIPLLDLNREHRSLKASLGRSLARIVANNQFIRGPAYKEFCRSFANFCQTAHCIGVANGTDALYLAIKALGLGPGDEIITSPLTFIAPAEAASNAGATVVFSDVEEQSFCLNPALIEAKISSKTKAVIPVHIFGQPADMDPILKLAASKRLRVIEDACQAHGARYRGRRAGSLGDLGCFSFYPTKNLGAMGDAGAVTGNNPDLAGRVASLADHGSRQKYIHEEPGINSRLDDFQAAVLLVKLPRLEKNNAKRRQWAALYGKLLEGAGDIICPEPAPGTEPVFHLYVVRSARRDALKDFLNARGIGAQVYYPVPLHLQSPYQKLGYHNGDFPVAERLCREMLALPMFPDLKEKEVRRVAAAVRSFFDTKAWRG
ncbi:MAG: DegT/DnrJ/EryC1/StrS family aminotransferase [Elusimicrobia bacterium]|nr:DegT/DnrJ/EryC1/StrS family aminotransferase [Elusimicrobiota bacterium]